MKKTFSLLLLIALLALSVTAFAAGSDYQSWVGVGVNYNFQPAFNQTTTEGSVIGNLQFNNSVGGGIEVGYKMQQYGVRARYDYYSATGSMTITTGDGATISPGSVSGNTMDYYAQVMGFMPINAVSDCYVGVGVGGLNQSVTIGNSTVTPVGGSPVVVPGATSSANAVGITDKAGQGEGPTRSSGH